MQESLPDFFQKVTKKTILRYQSRYGADPFSPSLVIIPTGLGKTDTVLVPWLFAQARQDRMAPTRLIIVLPRQNLTEQTARVARDRTNAASLASRVRVLELMAVNQLRIRGMRPIQGAYFGGVDSRRLGASLLIPVEPEGFARTILSKDLTEARTA